MFNHKKRDAETVRRIFNALKAKLESIRNHKTMEFLRLRKIRADTGSEICWSVINTWTNDHHILHELTCVDTPSPKGNAKVGGKISSKLARAMQLTSHTGDELKTALLQYELYID